MATNPLLPGVQPATIGVLGGGQLGRMLGLAARAMGYRFATLTPDANSPAAQVADVVHVADYHDVDQVDAFARHVDVMTLEFENVPAATAEAAAKHAPLRPGGGLLATAQDRLLEKDTMRRLGLPTQAYAAIDRVEEIQNALDEVGTPAVLKTRTEGYDGKGQRRVQSPADVAPAFAELGSRPCILERWVTFEREISVIGARGLDGEIALYEPFANDHVNHILDVTRSPARLTRETRNDAHNIIRSVLQDLDITGVLCIELFEKADGSLVFNEMAPRTHNSGHVTMDAHTCCQFEQQVRAICGLPLGDTTQIVPVAAMANLLGDLWREGRTPDWSAALAAPSVSLHLYGKSEARPSRKMGHLNAVGGDAVARVRAAREQLR